MWQLMHYNQDFQSAAATRKWSSRWKPQFSSRNVQASDKRMKPIIEAFKWTPPAPLISWAGNVQWTQSCDPSRVTTHHNAAVSSGSQAINRPISSCLISTRKLESGRTVLLPSKPLNECPIATSIPTSQQWGHLSIPLKLAPPSDGFHWKFSVSDPWPQSAQALRHYPPRNCYSSFPWFHQFYALHTIVAGFESWVLYSSRFCTGVEFSRVREWRWRWERSGARHSCPLLSPRRPRRRARAHPAWWAWLCGVFPSRVASESVHLGRNCRYPPHRTALLGRRGEE